MKVFLKNKFLTFASALLGLSLFMSLIVSLSPSVSQGSYLNNLFLCDLGMMNPDRSNTQGVDFVSYTQNGHTSTLRATPTGVSAIEYITNQVVKGYDRWNQNFSIDNVSFNLNSEFYGTQYYLEYCYMWDRQMPLDSIQYSITFLTSLPVTVPNTNFDTYTKCSTQYKNGNVVNSEFPQTSVVQNLLDVDQISQRCTIRLVFGEDQLNIRRPHNNDLGQVDPSVRVRVQP